MLSLACAEHQNIPDSQPGQLETVEKLCGVMCTTQHAATAAEGVS